MRRLAPTWPHAVIAESRRYWLLTGNSGFVFGNIFLVATFWLMRDSWILGATTDKSGQLWMYIGWVLVLGSTLHVCKELCEDMANRAIFRMIVKPEVLETVVGARFFISTAMSLISGVLVFLSAMVLESNAPEIRLVHLGAIVLLVSQSMCFAWIAAAITLLQNSVMRAQFAGIYVVLPITVLPIHALLGHYTVFVPISGPISVLAGASLNGLEFLFIFGSSLVLISGARRCFRSAVQRVVREGTLLKL